jgi:hypothetical protein
MPVIDSRFDSVEEKDSINIVFIKRVKQLNEMEYDRYKRNQFAVKTMKYSIPLVTSISLFQFMKRVPNLLLSIPEDHSIFHPKQRIRLRPQDFERAASLCTKWLKPVKFGTVAVTVIFGFITMNCLHAAYYYNKEYKHKCSILWPG